MRTYRPLPVTLYVWWPPVPPVTFCSTVQLVPSVDDCSWNAVAYAASQYSWIWLIEATWPRSTWIHCGSENAEDQRVPVVLPSTALAAVAVIAAYPPTRASSVVATTT